MTGAKLPATLRVLLTKSQESLLAELYQGGVRSHAQLVDSLLGGRLIKTEDKIVHVHVCNLRKKLKPLGITIQTVWGRGYMLTDESRAIIASMMREAA